MLLYLDPSSCISVSKETLSLPDLIATEPWQQEIVAFLMLWFDERDYVELKTSGSTGEPKMIRMPKITMLRSAQMTNTFFGLDENSVALLCLPASYIAGKMMLVRALAGKYKLIAVQPTANPFADVSGFPAHTVTPANNPFADVSAFPTPEESEIDTSSQNRSTQPAFTHIDFVAITPYQLIHSANDIPNYAIRNIIVGGSQVTPAMEQLTAEWPINMYETFGMTETASHIALRRFNGNYKSACFKALKDVELSCDDRGCLSVYAPHLHASKLITNDLVELVDATSFRWLGRFDRVVNSGGLKIFPEQVEQKLFTAIDLPFFITSVPDEMLGQQLVLVLESAELPDDIKNELIDHIRPIVDRYELPRQIICVPKFVYSEGNKLLRNETLHLHF